MYKSKETAKDMAL